MPMEGNASSHLATPSVWEGHANGRQLDLPKFEGAGSQWKGNLSQAM